MGRRFPVFGKNLHTQTSPLTLRKGLFLGEYPAITGPSASYGRKAEELRRKELLYDNATLVPVLVAKSLEAETNCGGCKLRFVIVGEKAVMTIQHYPQEIAGRQTPWRSIF